MTNDEFVTHACEQVLRFTQVENWNDLSEEIKVQLGFNMGVMAFGLSLTKENGFLALSNVRQGTVSMHTFRDHVWSLVASYKVEVDEAKIARPF